MTEIISAAVIGAAVIFTLCYLTWRDIKTMDRRMNQDAANHERRMRGDQGITVDHTEEA